MAALQAIRGIGFLSAVTMAAEAGDLRRFASARQFMAYTGLVPSEYSSGASGIEAGSPRPATGSSAMCWARPPTTREIGPT